MALFCSGGPGTRPRVSLAYRDVSEEEAADQHDGVDDVERFPLLRQVQQLLLERLAEGAWVTRAYACSPSRLCSQPCRSTSVSTAYLMLDLSFGTTAFWG